MLSAYEPLAREISRRYLQAGTPLAHDELVVATQKLHEELRTEMHAQGML